MDKEPQNRNLLMQYFTFAWQLIMALGLGVYAGLLADKWLHTSMPLLVWILPLLVLVGMMVKVIKDTTKK